MSWWEAIVLGIVEGFTEYLPVSSTGHLILTQRMLGIEQTEASDAYAVCIQAGAIIAVVGLYWHRIRDMLTGIASKFTRKATSGHGFELAVNIIVAFLPAAVIGLLFDDMIEEKLFGLWPIVIAWFVGGMAILGVSWWRRDHRGQAKDMPLENLNWKMALAIGTIQCLAMWPGTSRSLVTIVGGVLVGLSLTAAVEFSFLLGVLTLLAATVYKAKDAGPVMVEAYGWWPMIVGSIAAWVSAVIAVKWMVNYLKRHGMQLFGYYRVGLAIVVAIALAVGWLPS